MELSIKITALEMRRGGAEAYLTVNVGNGENIEVKKLALGTKMLRETANVSEDSLPFALTCEELDAIEYSSEVWRAVKKGLDILSFADNTRLTMIKKLRERGFDKYTAEDAADYLVRYGYIDEKRLLGLLVDKLANSKLYGVSRIKAELYKKGLSREVLDEHLDAMLSEVDFKENLIRLLRKKCDFSRIHEQKYRESVYAAMYRYGYSVSDTRAAIKIIREEYEE